MRDLICQAFNALPSRLIKLLWDVSFEDVMFKVNHLVADKQLAANQAFEAVSKTLELAFSSESAPSQVGNPESIIPKNAQEAQAVFSYIFGDGKV